MKQGIPFSILVVDDDEDDRLMINEAFGDIGYAPEVKKFINGKALLHYMQSIDPSLYPSLLVLDNTLPELNALDLLNILKSNPSYKEIPVVVYTTLLTTTKKEQLLAAGAYAAFEKGTTFEEIVQIAKELKAIAEQKGKNE
jgi:CheY-like chemotaxis protein